MRRAAGALATALRAALRLAPLLAAAAVLAQVALLGLRPARTEARRLASEEAALDGRLERLRAERNGLERRLSALHDPVYRERVRRAHARGRTGAGGPGADAPLELPLAGEEPGGAERAATSAGR